jgi:hypothetical protein
MFWLMGAIQSFLMDIFLLQPSKIWLHKIAVTGNAGVQVQHSHGLLRDRSLTIMTRTRGLIRNSSAIIQHLNPACRAARAYPELPAARLIMSLSDYDLPMNAFNGRKDTFIVFRRVEETIGFIGVVILFMLVILPEFIQESSLEISITFVVNISIFIAYLISRIEVFLPVILGLLLISGCWWFHILAVKRSKERLVRQQELLDSKLQLIIKSKPGVKYKKREGILTGMITGLNNLFGVQKDSGLRRTTVAGWHVVSGNTLSPVSPIREVDYSEELLSEHDEKILKVLKSSLFRKKASPSSKVGLESSVKVVNTQEVKKASPSRKVGLESSVRVVNTQEVKRAAYLNSIINPSPVRSITRDFQHRMTRGVGDEYHEYEGSEPIHYEWSDSLSEDEQPLDDTHYKVKPFSTNPAMLRENPTYTVGLNDVDDFS